MRSTRGQKRSLSGPCVAAAALLVCVYAWQILVPKPNETQGGSVLIRYTTPLGYIVDGAVVVVALFAFALGVVTLVRRARIGWLPLLASIAFLPVQIWTFKDSIFDSWSDEATVRTSGGAEYHMLARSWLEGTWALARLSGGSPLQRRYEVLTMGAMTDFGDGLRVVRPANAPKGDGLFVAPSGMVVGVDSDGLANVAYDPKTDFRYRSYSSPDEREQPIVDLSPFLLLGPLAIPDPSDVAKLRKPKDEGVKVIKADLNSPNPAVRRLARRLLSDAAGQRRR